MCFPLLFLISQQSLIGLCIVTFVCMFWGWLTIWFCITSCLPFLQGRLFLPLLALAAPQESGNNEVIFMALDLASLTSVQAFATAFLSSEPRLDILIHNAGEE